MKKKLICSILALSLALIPMGYLAPAQTVQAAEEKQGLERYQGYNVLNYSGVFYHPITEDTLLFEDVTKPETYTILAKDAVIGAIGLLYYDMTNTGFIYVEYGDIKGYVDARYIDMSTFTVSELPEMSADDIISVYNEKDGLDLVLTPNGKGWYTDQYGVARDAQGNDVNPANGQPFTKNYTVGGELHTQGMTQEEMSKILDNYSGLSVH